MYVIMSLGVNIFRILFSLENVSFQVAEDCGNILGLARSELGLAIACLNDSSTHSLAASLM